MIPVFTTGIFKTEKPVIIFFTERHVIDEGRENTMGNFKGKGVRQACTNHWREGASKAGLLAHPQSQSMPLQQHATYEMWKSTLRTRTAVQEKLCDS